MLLVPQKLTFVAHPEINLFRQFLKKNYLKTQKHNCDNYGSSWIPHTALKLAWTPTTCEITIITGYKNYFFSAGCRPCTLFLFL